MTDTRKHGYESGRKAVQVIRDANGQMGEAAIRMAELSPNPPNPKKSAEWNGGFRAGVREELDHDTRAPPTTVMPSFRSGVKALGLSQYPVARPPPPNL